MFYAKIYKQEKRLEIVHINSSNGIEQICLFHEQEKGHRFGFRNNVYFLYTKEEMIMLAKDEHYVHLVTMAISEYPIQGGIR